MADPFFPFLLDCTISAQGLVYLGWGGLALMTPSKSPLPAAPSLDAPAEVIKVLSVFSMTLGFFYIQSVYQANKTAMQWGVLSRLGMAVVLLSNGPEWKVAGLLEGGLALWTVLCLWVQPRGKTERPR